MIQRDRPLANDHPEGPASCKSLIHKVVGKNYVWYKMFSEFLSIHITLLLAQSHKGANLGNAQKKTFFFRRCSLSYFDDLHLFHLLMQVFSFTISGEKHTHGGLQSSFWADDHRSRTNLLGASRSIEFVLFMSISCTLHVHVLTLISWMNSASGRANIFQQVGPHRGANSRVGLKSPILTYARLGLGVSGEEWQLCQIILNKNVLSDVKCAKWLGPAKYHTKWSM